MKPKSNLIASVEVTQQQIDINDTIEIDLNGKHLKCKLPQFATSGTKLRLPGEGKNGGDLYLQLIIVKNKSKSQQVKVKEYCTSQNSKDTNNIKSMRIGYQLGLAFVIIGVLIILICLVLRFNLYMYSIEYSIFGPVLLSMGLGLLLFPGNNLSSDAKNFADFTTWWVQTKLKIKLTWALFTLSGFGLGLLFLFILSKPQ